MKYLRLKGLPWHSSVQDVIDFFKGMELDAKNVHLIKMPDGRDSGECLVAVNSPEQFTLCMSFDKHFMGKRYIELYTATDAEWERITNRKHRTNRIPISDDSEVLLMRGLPYSAQEDDCISFFAPKCKCVGVHLTKDRYGRPSGQGYAEFETQEDIVKALELDRSHMQNRYIELFKSSVNELVQAMSRGQSNHNMKNNRNRNQGNYRQQHKCVVQVIGLPEKCSELNIMEFFRVEDIHPLRIHLKSDGTEAFVELTSWADQKAAVALSRTHMGDRILEIFEMDYNRMMQKMHGHGRGRGSNRRHKYGKRFPNGRSLTLHNPHHNGPKSQFGSGPHGMSPYGNFNMPPFPRNTSPTGNGYLPPSPGLTLPPASSFLPGQSPTNGFIPPISPNTGFATTPSGMPNGGIMSYQYSAVSYPYHLQNFNQQSIVSPTADMNSGPGTNGVMPASPFGTYNPNSFLFPTHAATTPASSSPQDPNGHKLPQMIHTKINHTVPGTCEVWYGLSNSSV